MRAMKWARRVALAIGASAVLALGVVVSATAAEVNGTGPIAAGESVTLTCPEGERFAGTGTADFWRKLSGNAAHYLGSAQFVASGDGTSATAGPAPKGSKFYSATMNCEPIPTEQVVTQTGRGTGSSFSVNCPADYPYLRSVFEVIVDNDGDFSTTGDQRQPGYSTTDTGVNVDAVSILNYWRVSLYCSSLPQH